MNRLAEAWRDAQLGAYEVAANIGSGMLAQPLAGLYGLLTPTRGDGNVLDRARARIEKAQEALTYQPRSSVGQRGLENVGKAIETVTRPVMDHVVDPIGDRVPVLGAGILAAANVLGPKGKPKTTPKTTPKAAARTPEFQSGVSQALREGGVVDTPRFDPGSPQQLLPGVEPLTLAEAHSVALRDLNAAREAMSFEDVNRGVRFDYTPNLREDGPAWVPDHIERPDDLPSEVMFTAGKRPVSQMSERPVMEERLEGQQSRVGSENHQRMLELSERLRDAENTAIARGTEEATTRARELTERINRTRALAEEPGINADQQRTLQEEILAMQRQRPITIGETTLTPTPGEGLFSPITWRTALGDDQSALARGYLRERPGYLAIQKRIVRQLRGEPEDIQPRRPTAPRSRLEDIPGRDPNAMNRDAVAQFLDEAKGQEGLFEYGLMPPRSVRSLDDFAEHFDPEIRVHWEHADSDEPYKIKEPKTHGRGEVMRDRHGDYRMKTLEEGDKLKDEHGDYKTKEKEVELVGPPEESSVQRALWGTKEVPKRAEGGEWKRDESGEYVYQKSRGGEPVRDERGRQKYEERENPDYGEFEKATLTGPKGGKIEITYGEPASILATAAGGKGEGQKLYQAALAHASRNGIDIGGGGLTGINQYRLLSNVISNIARTGVNTRDLSGTRSGNAERPRSWQAEGPEVWRAEAEEGMHRLRSAGVDPDRVRFDPENGFSIDGQAATPADIQTSIRELSPLYDKGKHDEYRAGVGPKSLARNAVFQWLRTASPEDARRVAAKWPKEWGPVFAGIAAQVGAGAIQDEGMSQD